ncbi:hypothetical protein NDA18_006645 [Ustilago nuda]|nr:hypothetical protein NDA18_006645 [Ustilago nuda]
MSILQRIARTLGWGKWKYMVGQDLAGNCYLELPSLSGSIDPRHTRRSIQWREKKELGDYDQRSIPVQWVMWLRHTRREAPTVEELARDRQRILTTQANAQKLALQDRATRQREQQARLEQHTEAKERAQKLMQSPVMAEIGATLEQERVAHDDVWAASRARLAADGQLPIERDRGHPDSLQQAMERRAARREAKSQEQAERERARREMSKSPLDAFVPMPKARK